MLGDELLHLVKQAAAQGGDIKPFLYGHIASYDPTQHRVRCIIPSMTDQDGNPTLSPWLPMMSNSTGNGYGAQFIPFGGATADNPTAGEQVIIGMFDRQRGVGAVMGMLYHGVSPPPATNLPKQSDGFTANAAANAPGDFIISAPPTQAGGANSFIRMRQNGNVEVWSAAQLNINTIGDSNLNVGGNVTAAVSGDVTATVTGNATVTAATVTIVGATIMLTKAIGDSLHTLCTDLFQGLFNLHTHDDGGPPNQQSTAAQMTSVLTAE